MCSLQWLTPALLLIFNLRCLQTPAACRCPLRTDVWSALQTESVFWQMWGNFPTAQHRPQARFWHPFPLVGNPHVKEEAGNRPGSADKSSFPGHACGFSFLTQHPWGSDSSGWEFPSSLSGDRDQSPVFFLWLSTRLSSNLCLGVTLVGLIFVYGDQLGQIWWEGLPQNTDEVLISFSREEGSWGFGLDVHLTVTQLVTCCPHRQNWHPRSRSGGYSCAVARMSGQSGELCGLQWVQGLLHPWVREGKEVWNCLVCCGSLETLWCLLVPVNHPRLLPLCVHSCLLMLLKIATLQN